MAVDIKIHKGSIVKVGDSVSSAVPGSEMTVYSHAEFSDGAILRKLAVLTGLDGEFTRACGEGREVELHVASMEGAPWSTLLAIKAGDRLYAMEMPKQPLVFSLLPLFVLFGLVTLPFLGFGFIILFFSWKLFKAKGVMATNAEYVRKLHGAVYI